MTPTLAEHFFRHEYGRLVATLSRRIGVQNIEIVEDAVQTALMRALESWRDSGLPENPSAWLYRVARNLVIDDLRKVSGHRRILGERGRDVFETEDPPAHFLPSEVQDDLLRLLFLCCDDKIPPESQLILALKALCGFSVREIALRLFLSDANVYKRLARAKAHLRAMPSTTDDVGTEQLASRCFAVHQVLYVLFTEGYLSSHVDAAIRRELCDEAIRLGLILAGHPVGNTPETSALLALMHLHAARTAARKDTVGDLVLLEDQDRSLFDRSQIEQGLAWLARSADGDTFTRFHAEAAIAAEHCLALTFAETRWDRVAENYAQLERIAPSPLHRLNRALAVAEWQGPEAGLAILAGYIPPTWLLGSHMWAAALADLHRRCGHEGDADRHREDALRTAPTAAIRDLLCRRLSVGNARGS